MSLVQMVRHHFLSQR